MGVVKGTSGATWPAGFQGLFSNARGVVSIMVALLTVVGAAMNWKSLQMVDGGKYSSPMHKSEVLDMDLDWR